MKSIIELVTATTLKTSPDNAEECCCTNPTRQPVLPTHGPCPACCLQSVTCIVRLSWSPFYLLTGQVVRFPNIAEVRPLPNCSLSRACSQDRITSEHGYNEITRLDCRGFSKQASLPPPLSVPPLQRDGPLTGLHIFFLSSLAPNSSSGYESQRLTPHSGVAEKSVYSDSGQEPFTA